MSPALALLKTRLQSRRPTPREAAFALLAFTGRPLYRKLCFSLASRVQSGEDWLQRAPLDEVALRVHALYRHNPRLVDGACTAWLAKRLLTAEQAVGGPYHEAAGNDFVTNGLIAQLFLSFGHPLPNVVNYLKDLSRAFSLQALDPASRWVLSWPHRIVLVPAPFVPAADHTIESLAIAVCLEQPVPPISLRIEQPAAHNPVAAHVQQQLEQLGDSLRPLALSVWQAIVTADKHQEVSMLATYFAQSLARPPDEITDEMCRELGVANFYAWMAYSIYDDFIDDEGRAYLLPVANTMHRASLWSYKAFSQTGSEYETVLKDSYNQVDAANAWELAHCRFPINRGQITVTEIPVYGDRMFLARRAIGHVLGPAIIALRIDALTARQRTAIHEGLAHYLIARQLNDDAHDWVADLRSGHVSFVVAFLLRQADINPGTYVLENLIAQLQTIFWQQGLQAMCDLTLEHIGQARRLFAQSGALKADGPFFTRVLNPIEAAAHRSAAIHREQKRFLQTYANSPA